MKILMCSNFFYRRGGDCAHMFSVADLLEEHGHEAVFFSMNHPKNMPCSEQKYFIDHIDYEELNQNRSISSVFRVLKSSIYSRQARRNIGQLIRDLKPDVAHLHSINNHLTPSILFELERMGVPAVMTLHDLKFLCPDGVMLSNGRVCDECRGKSFYKCISNRCKKGSLGASVFAAADAYATRLMKATGRINRFIAPSCFLKNKFVECGYDPEKFLVIRNFLDDQDVSNSPVPGEGYGAYLGRLDQIKGLDTLLEAMPEKARFKLAGEGPDEGRLKAIASSRNLRNVEFVGRLDGDALRRFRMGADYGVLPSVCYENCPLSVMEMMALGKPVVGAQIGGIPELIEHGRTGWLFEPGNVGQLSEALLEVLALSSEDRMEMGRNAIRWINENARSKTYYNAILEAYKQCQL